MDSRAGPSHGDSDEEAEGSREAETPAIDSALGKRAQQVREKYQDDTYAWIMRTLEVGFECYQGEGLVKVVADLTDVAEKFCLQDLEYNETKAMFERFCRLHPIKSSPQGFSHMSEFEKYKVKEWKLNKNDAKNHPKFKKFLARVKELDKGKHLSQTDAIAIE